MRARLVLCACALAGCTAPPPPADPGDPLGAGAAPRLTVEYPAEGAILGGPPSAFLAGRVAAGIERGERLDVVLAIDTSGSACAPVGASPLREDGCGEPGSGTGPAPGRVIDVEIAAARALLARLDPELTRVGVVRFGAGAPIRRSLHRFEGPDTGFAGTRLEIAPTADFSAVAGVLDDLARLEPDGATNLAGALGRASQALTRAQGSPPRRLVVLLSDGIPTAPRETDRENLVEALNAAGRAARRGVRVLSFAIGEAAREPVAALEVARRTGGAFYPVHDAAALPEVFRVVQLDQIADLEVTNLTTGAPAAHERLAPEGGFDAIVALAPGRNRLAIRALTEAGVAVQRELSVTYVPGGDSPALPAGLEARRAAARNVELGAVAARGATLEREALALSRARILAEIAAARSLAEEVAERQRRELSLEVDEPDVAAPPR